MSKITFRADDDLVRRLEAFDASKSEVMREALRTYLDEAERGTAPDAPEESADDALVRRVDELVAERLDARLRGAGREAADVNVNVRLEGVRGEAELDRGDEDARTRKTTGSGEDGPSNSEHRSCGQCGEGLTAEHVYCPNCGEKASHRVFCECGDELRSDWGFCPGCGRRTPAADVLDRS